VTAGDPIWYLQTIAGGYDYARRVPGTFLWARPRRWLIELELKDGTRRTVHVLPRKVVPRVIGEAP
jgi:hypothetical protein